MPKKAGHKVKKMSRKPSVKSKMKMKKSAQRPPAASLGNGGPTAVSSANVSVNGGVTGSYVFNKALGKVVKISSAVPGVASVSQESGADAGESGADAGEAGGCGREECGPGSCAMDN